MHALVLGGAARVYDDAREAQALMDQAGLEFGAVVACNEIGIRWPAITHWVTLHPEKFGIWQNARAAAGLPADYVTVVPWDTSAQPAPRINHKLSDWAGSSGLYAVKVALELAHATHVIVAGVPMTHTPHFNDEKAWGYAEAYRQGWTIWRRNYERRTRSMSGWTMQQVGAPTVEWLTAPAG